MRIIIENIVGLFRFIGLLFSVLILPSKSRSREGIDYRPEIDNPDKYEALLGQPSGPLCPIETKFCPRCHVALCQVSRTKQGIQIIQHGKVLVTVGGNVTVTRDGRETTGFPVKCPSGHIVRIE